MGGGSKPQSTVIKMADMVEMFTAVPLIIIGGLMVAVVLLGTFCRYVLNAPLLWTEEAARYLMIWMALVAASISMKRHEHVGVGFILERLPMPIGRAVKILTDLAVAFFLVVLTYQGWIMALDARVQVSPALGIPMFWPLLSVPISGFFMLVQLVLRMAANLMHRETSGL